MHFRSGSSSFGRQPGQGVPPSRRSGRFQRTRLPRAQSDASMVHTASTSQCPSRPSRAPHLPTALSAPSLPDFLCDEGDSEGSDTESVLSEFDLVNDTIQELLLASDSSDSESRFSDTVSGDLTTTTTLCTSALLPVRGVALPGGGDGAVRRGRTARKSASCETLSTMTARRLHGNLSVSSLLRWEGDAELGLPHKERRRKGVRRGVTALREGWRESPLVGRRTSGSDSGGTLSSSQRPALLKPLKPVHRGAPVGPLSIVLDVDETLVSARHGAIHVRPHVKAFLDLCEELRCEIIVWTAGVASYVNPILHAIANTCHRKAWFHHIISRHRRWYHEDDKGEASGVKDLQLLGRPLERVLLIENNPISVCRQPMNAILVEDYSGPNECDDSLRTLAGIVRRAVVCLSEDVAEDTADEQDPSLPARRRRPILTPAVPIAAFLDKEEALTYTTFAIEDIDDGGEEGGNEEGTHRTARRWRRGQPLSCPAEAPNRSHLRAPDLAGERREVNTEQSSSGNEEEQVGGASPEAAMVVPAKGSRTLRCRILQASPYAASSLEARCYGCLHPIVD